MSQDKKQTGAGPKFEERTQAEQGFAPLWEQHVVPQLAPYQAAYKQKMWIGIWATLLAIAIGVICWLIFDRFFADLPENDQVGFFVFVFFGEIALLLGGWWPLYRLGDDPLGFVMPAIEAHFAPYFQPDDNHGFAALQSAHLREEGLTGPGEIDISEHYSGAYRDCRIRFYTASHRHRSSTAGQTFIEKQLDRRGEAADHYLIFSISVPFDFTGETRIETDKGRIRNKLRAVESEFAQYKVPDATFEKAFEVFTNDNAGAQALITPALAENMLAIKAFYKTQKGGRFSGQFKDRHFTMAVHGGGNLTTVGTGMYAPEQIDGLARTLILRFATILQLVDMLHGDRP